MLPAAAALALAGAAAHAHPGRTAADGCHFQRSTGIRHCHSQLPAGGDDAAGAPAATGQIWRGIAVAPEHRCSPYDRSDYSYPQEVELRIIDRQGGMFSPYTGETFASRRESDIEHIVAISEAHDSGACAWPQGRRRAFARDPDNLTLASPGLNRHEKRGKDFAEWQPPRNRCWMAATVVAVKRKYGLSVDRAEQQALQRVLAGCQPEDQ